MNWRSCNCVLTINRFKLVTVLFSGLSKNTSFFFSLSQQIFSNSYFVKAFAEHDYFQTLATLATLGKYPSGHYCDRPSRKSFYQQRLLPKSFRHTIFLQRGVQKMDTPIFLHRNRVREHSYITSAHFWTFSDLPERQQNGHFLKVHVF